MVVSTCEKGKFAYINYKAMYNIYIYHSYPNCDCENESSSFVTFVLVTFI